MKLWCFDCGSPGPWYMVNNEVWKAAWPEGEPAKKRLSTLATAMFPKAQRRSPDSGKVIVAVCLCFLCLERRLKRPLTIADFQRKASSGNDIWTNAGIFFGYRLGLRDAQKALKLGDKKDEGG